MRTPYLLSAHSSTTVTFVCRGPCLSIIGCSMCAYPQTYTCKPVVTTCFGNVCEKTPSLQSPCLGKPDNLWSTTAISPTKNFYYYCEHDLTSIHPCPLSVYRGLQHVRIVRDMLVNIMCRDMVNLYGTSLYRAAHHSNAFLSPYVPKDALLCHSYRPTHLVV